MYKDWKDFYKPFMPSEEHIPDNICSKSFNSLSFFVVLGFIASLGLLTTVESKAINYPDNNPLSSKIEKVKENIKNIEMDNTILESQVLILSHTLTQTFENKEKEEMLKLSNLTGTHKKIGSGIIFSDTTVKTSSCVLYNQLC